VKISALADWQWISEVRAIALKPGGEAASRFSFLLVIYEVQLVGAAARGASRRRFASIFTRCYPRDIPRI
ncbi:MAG: hypothetical protein WA673_23775, partial [Candidatus Acidiferrales bacterium]